jgi:hypothetical protein
MKISILMHRQDPPMEHYMLAVLADDWRGQGHQVEVIHGVDRPIRADVVFLHVDLTVVPEEYMRAVDGHPCVVNHRVRDISKTLYSPYLVRGPEDWEGPVIVKTVRNHGAYPERLVRRRTAVGRLQHLMTRLPIGGLARADHLHPMKYPIFPSSRNVPPGVFANPHLIVQRYLPERSGEFYCKRLYTFLGDQHKCEWFKLSHPLWAAEHIVERKEIPAPDEILAARERLGFDYGKFDFVVHEGEVILLDANRTPGSSRTHDWAGVGGGRLAPGIGSYVR